ncbi:hypothetical protein TBLA_0J00520 [Henningerozyma blattae CBS 6284]|uniref:Transcription factor CBF/NF-Y/archaeal histone domain-containing protein n=1 Tax=Henningerozyma blattae (strain ATCC 34711 / CBS 6284 / DSM 70876 / NBRC 10599 / NRRL Y-10934 / UCD 77-7) TaxID=1071380 RepID=I2H9K0_HENB6|nr:hypothetical protein TBLA_0J00520 [Tetrapisispora blattae CBS 6284]CCH63052.1 hypothetical protein TBLA_0J00520 [Tetrapisispora blattae CBS 6284]
MDPSPEQPHNATLAHVSSPDGGNEHMHQLVDEPLTQVFDRVKTHFPPAKIKKIMQTDEDIGKVSQATPVLAGKALECFIALLVQRSCAAAGEAGARRVSGEILRDTILHDEQFDFLRDTVCGGQARDVADDSSTV